jgi:hypothetical protein
MEFVRRITVDFFFLHYYYVIMYACCHVCMYVITFSNRNIFHGFTLVTTLFSEMCHVENKGRSLVRYIKSTIKERAQSVCVCVCVCLCVKKKNRDEGRNYERNSSLLNFGVLLSH